jgi:hypothetical protein
VTTPTAAFRQGVVAFKIPNLPTYDSAGDTFSAATATSAASINCGPRTRSGGVALAALAFGASPGTITPTAGWTTIQNGVIGGTGGVYFCIAYQLPTTNSAIAWAPTWVTSQGYNSYVFAYT